MSVSSSFVGVVTAAHAQELVWKTKVTTAPPFQPTPSTLRVPQVFFLDGEHLVVRSPLEEVPFADRQMNRSLVAVLAVLYGKVLTTRLNESPISNGDVQIAPTADGQIVELTAKNPRPSRSRLGRCSVGAT